MAEEDKLPALPDRIFDHVITGGIGEESDFQAVDQHRIRVVFDEYRLNLAKECMHNALLAESSAAPLTFTLPSASQASAMAVSRNPFYRLAVQMVAVILTLCIAFEELHPTGERVHISQGLWAVSIVSLLLLFLDNILLIVAAGGAARFFAVTWNRMYSATLLLQLANMTWSVRGFVS